MSSVTRSTSSGSLSTLNYSQNNSSSTSQSLLTTACKINDLSAVKRAIGDNVQPDANTLDAAIATGNAKIVDLVLSAGAKPTQYTFSYAAGQNPEILKAVAMSGVQACAGAFAWACNTGNIEQVKLAHTLGAKVHNDLAALDRALKSGNRQVIDYMINLGAKPNDEAFDLAFSLKDRTLLQSIAKLGAKPSKNSIQIALKMYDFLDDVLAAGAKASPEDLVFAIEMEPKKETFKVCENVFPSTAHYKSVLGKLLDTGVVANKSVSASKELLYRCMRLMQNHHHRQGTFERILDRDEIDEDLLNKLIKAGIAPTAKCFDLLDYNQRDSEFDSHLARNELVILKLLLDYGAKPTSNQMQYFESQAENYKNEKNVGNCRDRYIHVKFLTAKKRDLLKGVTRDTSFNYDDVVKAAKKSSSDCAVIM